jgi:hypothetical protein
MIAFIIFVSCFFIGWFAYCIVEWRRDARWRRFNKKKFDESWRQVPPPNWRSSRGGREYW